MGTRGLHFDKYYVFLRDKRAWEEGDNDFGKFHDNLPKADEDTTETAFVENLK